MSAQIIPFPAPPAEAQEAPEVLPEPPAPRRVHWWWRVENIILTTLAIAYAVLVWGSHLRFLAGLF